MGYLETPPPSLLPVFPSTLKKTTLAIISLHFNLSSTSLLSQLLMWSDVGRCERAEAAMARGAELWGSTAPRLQEDTGDVCHWEGSPHLVLLPGFIFSAGRIVLQNLVSCAALVFRRKFPPTCWCRPEVLTHGSAKLWNWKCNFCYFSHWVQLNHRCFQLKRNIPTPRV